MSDIVYTIGAKDQATPQIKKVDSALGRLEKSTKDLGESSQKSLGKFSLSIGSLAKAASVLGGVMIAAKGVRSAFGLIASGVDDFDAAEESMRALDQAMELNGGSSDALVQKYADLSDAIEANTNIAAEETQALMKQAAVLGVSNDQLGNMATAAVGLSEALGVSLEDGLEKARLATEGNFKAFEKLLPSIKQMQTDEEKLAAVMELSARGMAMKEAASQSAGGEAERMNHRIGNLMETIGAMIAPIREIAYQGIALLADGLSNVLGPAVESSKSLFESWGPTILSTIEFAVNSIISSLTMAEVVYNNFGDVVDFVLSSVMLAYETYRADTEYLFTTTLPAYVAWFADNFYNILETGFNAVVTLVTNSGQMIADAFSAIWDFISSGGQTDVLADLGEVAGRNLMEGFTSTIKSMPEIAGRAMTDREQELTATMGTIGNKLAGEFSDKFNERAVKLGEKVGENLAEGIDLQLKNSAEESAKEVEKKLGIDSLSQSKSGGGGGDSKLQAFESRLLTRGPGDRRKDPSALLEELISETKAVKEATEATASEVAEIKNNQLANPQLQVVGVP